MLLTYQFFMLFICGVFPFLSSSFQDFASRNCSMSSRVVSKYSFNDTSFRLVAKKRYEKCVKFELHTSALRCLGKELPQDNSDTNGERS